jgi:hypothetical protein
MRVVLYPFMLLAAAGLVLSLAAHLMALAGIPIPGGKTVFALHIGVFVVWIPAVIVSIRVMRRIRGRKFWHIVLENCPFWMRTIVQVTFIYAIANFVLFLISTAGHPVPAGDPSPPELRGFSGHWMVFYAAAFAALYATIHSPNLLGTRYCYRGHAVSQDAVTCPDCGAKLRS